MSDSLPVMMPDDDAAPNTTEDGAWACPRCPWSGLAAPPCFDGYDTLVVECPECEQALAAVPTMEQLTEADDE